MRRPLARRRLRLAPLLAIAPLLSGLAAPARGSDTPAAAPAPKVAPLPKRALVDHVRVAAGGKQWSGFPLAKPAAGGLALLTDDGRVALLGRTQKIEPLETTQRPLSSVPAAGLATGLAHADEAVRDRCEQLLLEQGDLAQPALAAAATDASAEARRRALTIAAKLAPAAPKAATPWIARARARLTDVDESVRRAALSAYVASGADDVRVRCEDLLQFDESLRVRHDAIVQLGRSGDLRAVDSLLAELPECEERSLKVAAFDSLRRLTGKNYGRDEARWRAWWRNHRFELVRDPAR